ncbi:hypothetical protein K458DRAFT_339248 [Lentithecium fluviatile CBS 122367]|uniref:Mitochondrial intermembrane space import and assembly protein 40 n=1 Tax=Lentithecium fluviatile CBS 122367 TaxID=1168545 RepID=A0A6G1J1K4_9PLEO|nr:hypothetical protein K458DRAFT_339248 [Lentithecium fluviatile CBS 122367]
MFRPATRLITRPSALRAIPRAAAPARRFLSTAPPTQKSRSWKSLAARIGIAGAIIYYYNTYEVFAEEPKHTVHSLPETDVEVATLPTIEDVAKERQQRKAQLAAAQQKEDEVHAPEGIEAPDGSVAALEEEAGQQGAFNPETGEINWECPCLGGMAHGPCGEEFKAAFSCFVFSTEEPKGMDCIDKFKGMQNCFREYPEIYGAELDNEEEDDDVAVDLAQSESGKPTDDVASEKAEPVPQEASDSAARDIAPRKKDHSLVPESYRPSADDDKSKTDTAEEATEQVHREHEPVSESERIVPKASHDATEANETK